LNNPWGCTTCTPQRPSGCCHASSADVPSPLDEDRAAAPSLVDHTVKEVGGALVAEDRVKSTASRAAVPVPLFVIDELTARVSREGLTDPDSYLFTAPEGGPVRGAAFRHRVWPRAVRAAGLEGLTFHGLRHTLAGLLIRAGRAPEGHPGPDGPQHHPHDTGHLRPRAAWRGRRGDRRP
jgi:hypothetical protein